MAVSEYAIGKRTVRPHVRSFHWIPPGDEHPAYRRSRHRGVDENRRYRDLSDPGLIPPVVNRRPRLHLTGRPPPVPGKIDVVGMEIPHPRVEVPVAVDRIFANHRRGVLRMQEDAVAVPVDQVPPDHVAALPEVDPSDLVPCEHGVLERYAGDPQAHSLVVRAEYAFTDRYLGKMGMEGIPGAFENAM